jgi:hypothetical protein
MITSECQGAGRGGPLIEVALSSPIIKIFKGFPWGAFSGAGDCVIGAVIGGMRLNLASTAGFKRQTRATTAAITVSNKEKAFLGIRPPPGRFILFSRLFIGELLKKRPVKRALNTGALVNLSPGKI